MKVPILVLVLVLTAVLLLGGVGVAWADSHEEEVKSVAIQEATLTPTPPPDPTATTVPIVTTDTSISTGDPTTPKQELPPAIVPDPNPVVTEKEVPASSLVPPKIPSRDEGNVGVWGWMGGVVVLAMLILGLILFWFFGRSKLRRREVPVAPPTTHVQPAESAQQSTPARLDPLQQAVREAEHTLKEGGTR